MLKEKEVKELEQAGWKQGSAGSIDGSVDDIEDHHDDDDDIVYAINAKSTNTGNEKDKFVGKMKVPLLANTSISDNEDDEEFKALTQILQESIKSARSSRASGRQKSVPTPTRVFPHVETGIPGESFVSSTVSFPKYYVFVMYIPFHFYVDSARVSSVHRKTRRFTYFMSLYQQLAGKNDNLDILSMKKHLIDQQNRLLRLIDFYRKNRVDLPKIKREYEHDLSLMVNVDMRTTGPLAQCNPVLALMCAHLLKYSPKLQSLMSIYKREGRATLSRVGFFTAAEECFQILESRLFYEKQVEQGSILEQLIQVSRMRLSKTALLEERAVGHETAVFFRCEFHGETSFYATDLFCQQCDVDYAQLED